MQLHFCKLSNIAAVQLMGESSLISLATPVPMNGSVYVCGGISMENIDTPEVSLLVLDLVGLM